MTCRAGFGQQGFMLMVSVLVFPESRPIGGRRQACHSYYMWAFALLNTVVGLEAVMLVSCLAVWTPIC